MIAEAIFATVPPSNSIRSGSSTPNILVILEMTRVAISECPPNSKKLSWTLGWSIPKTSAQTSANATSSGVRGET